MKVSDALASFYVFYICAVNISRRDSNISLSIDNFIEKRRRFLFSVVNIWGIMLVLANVVTKEAL